MIEDFDKASVSPPDEQYTHLNHQDLRNAMQTRQGMRVLTAPSGRFILPIPELGGPDDVLLLPNIKEIEARLRGSDGKIKVLELEAGPQRVPTDGTNAVVINRVDEFVQLALTAKLNALVKKSQGEMSRGVVDEFMAYARGYTYDPLNQTVRFTSSAGFRNDVYNMPLAELKQRYVLFDSPETDLNDMEDSRLAAGYYIKKPLLSHAVFIRGSFQVPVSAGAGNTMQVFEDGALMNIPDDPALPLSFVHITDIDTCYIHPDGTSLLDESGHPSCLPVYDAKDLIAAAPAPTPAVQNQHRANP